MRKGSRKRGVKEERSGAGERSEGGRHGSEGGIEE